MTAKNVKVLSERTLDNKTITLNDTKSAIEVKISDEDNNALKVKEDGIFVEQPTPDLIITDLAGNPFMVFKAQ